MQCPCCGKCDMDNEFMDALQSVRTKCDFGFKVNSAYRCQEHNAKVSKNTKGQHSTGLAADISMKDRYKRYLILREAINSGYFKDIAISSTFIPSSINISRYILWMLCSAFKHQEPFSNQPLVGLIRYSFLFPTDDEYASSIGKELLPNPEASISKKINSSNKKLCLFKFMRKDGSYSFIFISLVNKANWRFSSI